MTTDKMTEEIQKILKPYENDIPKMIEDFIKFKTRLRSSEEPTQLFEHQKMILSTLELNEAKQNVLVKHSHQLGISTVVAAYYACKIFLAKEKFTLGIVLNRNDNGFFLYLRYFIKQIYLKLIHSSELLYNIDSAHNPMLSCFNIKRNKSGTYELFNGCSLVITYDIENLNVDELVIDNAAFFRDSKSKYNKLNTLIANSNSRCVLMSCPYTYDYLFKQTYLDALNGTNNFKSLVFYWYQHPSFNQNLKWVKTSSDCQTIIDTIDEEEYTFQSYELKLNRGYKPTNEWYENTCKLLAYKVEYIQMEVDNSL